MGTGTQRSASSTPLDMDAIAQGAKDAVDAGLCGKPFRWDQRLFSVILGSGGGGRGGSGTEGYDGAGRLGGGVTEETVAALRVRGRDVYLFVLRRTGDCYSTRLAWPICSTGSVCLMPVRRVLDFFRTAGLF